MGNNKTVSIAEISKQNMRVLWERSAKVIVPIAAVGGFVSDVLAPLGGIVAALALLTGGFCVLSGVIWFGFKRRQIRRALADGMIDADEYEKIGATNTWSVAFAVNFIAAVVLTAFFGAQKVFAGEEPDRGMMANAFPQLARLQDQLLGLQKTTERIEAQTTRIEKQTARIAAHAEKTAENTELIQATTADTSAAAARIEKQNEEMSRTISSLDAKVAGLQAQPAESAAEANAACPESRELAPYGKVFENADVRVEMATFSATNPEGEHDVLLRIKGAPAFEAGIDGKAIRYLTRRGYGGGLDFKYHDDQGREPTRMIFRRDPASDSEVVRVFLKDGKAHDLKFNAVRSKTMCPSALR